MTYPWPQWLAALSRAQKGPLLLPDAVRGQFYGHRLRLAGDWTGAVLTGEVRASPDANAVLVAFTITVPVFADSKTTWEFSLAAGSGSNSTGVLPADGDFDGIEYFPYDFLLRPFGGVAERLVGGLLPVTGRITEPA